ncbi:MAG TPA: hypothetical protein VGH63_17595, partial [Polyangia bacterium]
MLAKLLMKEGKRRILMLSGIFSAVALLALGVGLMLPKRYDASALILIEADAGFKLSEGHSGPSVADQAAVISQIVLGRQVMREVLAFGGWVKPPPARLDPRQEEQLIAKLRSHIKIETQRDEMVRIGFSDSDPKRAYEVTNKLAEIYLRESDAGKERQSREAFEFVDEQVKQYGAELTDMQQKVLDRYRSDGGKTTPAPSVAKSSSSRKVVTDQELAELRAEQAHLQAQVSRKSAPAARTTDAHAEEQARARVVQLRAELDRLLATFTDEHPDVKRVKRELATAQEELDRAEQASADREASSQLAAKLDDEMTAAARQRLEDVQRRLGGDSVRTPTVTPVRAAAEDSIDPDMKTVGRDATLSELLRRYEAARDSYHMLLRRRYDAKVTMEAAAQHRSFSLHIQEPAEMPASASSLRLMHMALISLFLAAAIPIGLLVLLVRFDRHVRSPHQI